jgi:nitroreductase
MASLSIALQAVALGLVAHQMGGWDVEKARAAFAIPPEYTPMSFIAVGYQAEPDVLDEETKAKELRPRGRKPLDTHFFEGGWGKGYAA